VQKALSPVKPPPQHEMMRLVGRIGGHLECKCDGEPGITVLWRGWMRLYADVRVPRAAKQALRLADSSRPMRCCGRPFTLEDLARVRGLICATPPLHRAPISRKVCARFGWSRRDGRLKDTCCRVTLRRMQADALILLPPPRNPKPPPYLARPELEQTVLEPLSGTRCIWLRSQSTRSATSPSLCCGTPPSRGRRIWVLSLSPVRSCPTSCVQSAWWPYCPVGQAPGTAGDLTRSSVGRASRESAVFTLSSATRASSSCPGSAVAISPRAFSLWSVVAWPMIAMLATPNVRCTWRPSPRRHASPPPATRRPPGCPSATLRGAANSIGCIATPSRSRASGSIASSAISTDGFAMLNLRASPHGSQKHKRARSIHRSCPDVQRRLPGYRSLATALECRAQEP
jgi:hypothetical protein